MPEPAAQPFHDRVPRRHPEAVAQPVRGATALLNVRTEEYFSLNEVGARVWALIDGQRPLADIVATLQSEYDVDEAELRADVEELLADLAASGLITWADEAR
jgi:hypothetical protein